MRSTKKKTKNISDHSIGVMTIHAPEPVVEYDDTDSAEKARAAYHAALNFATPDQIMAGLQRALASQEWGAGPRGEGIPPAADWLRSRGWERAYTPEARA
jgi:hypothetical protein